MNGHGYTYCIFEYNSNEQWISKQFFDLSQNPVCNEYGYAGVNRLVNEQGWLLRETFVGLKGERVTNENGFAVHLFTYDNNGHLLLETFYSDRNTLAVLPAGYTYIQYTYDDWGILLKVEPLDISKNPVNVDLSQEVWWQEEQQSH